MGGVQLVELPVHNPPSLHLLLCELNARNGIPTAARENNEMNTEGKTSQISKITIKISNKSSLFVGHSEISKVLSPFPVNIVLETLMKSNIEGCENASNLKFVFFQLTSSRIFSYIPDDPHPTRSRTSGHG